MKALPTFFKLVRDWKFLSRAPKDENADISRSHAHGDARIGGDFESPSTFVFEMYQGEVVALVTNPLPLL
eukprot:7865-Karenia_brevis.AAC.1